MESCNEKRRRIQGAIVEEARGLAQAHSESPILFLGGEWHQGVVGIAASKLVEEFWRPVWLFERQQDLCKGSARSVPGFDVTAAMSSAAPLFAKFGGHAAAGGFTFSRDNEASLRVALTEFASELRRKEPHLWESRITYDCLLSPELIDFELLDALEELKPFGHGFEEPKFLIEGEVVAVKILNDKATGKPKHTSVVYRGHDLATHKIMFFNRVVAPSKGTRTNMIVSVGKNNWQGQTSLALYGHDISAH
jgi:single-stranded-DNA-specific exonuclease